MMNISTGYATTLVLAVLLSGVDIPEQQTPIAQQGDAGWQNAQLFAVEGSETIILAGNTACNPRAQVCEE